MTILDSRKRALSPGLVVGIITNTAGFAAGAVFFAAAYGARFRGMEPEAKIFLSLGLLAAAGGLVIGLPVSIGDCFEKRWIQGALGCILAFTPAFVATLVAELAAFLLDITWD